MGAFRRIGAGVVSAAFLALLAVPEIASAQSIRTWVSSAGDDANACTRAAPCRTFQGALGKTTVAGVINCVDSGDFTAPGSGVGLLIGQTVTIDCTGVSAGVFKAVGNFGVVIDAPGATVVLRSLTINGSATGLVVNNAAVVHVEDVATTGNSGDGIVTVSHAPLRLTLVRVLSRSNGRHGLWVSGFFAMANVSVVDSTFADNALVGLLVTDTAFGAITSSIASGNGTHGIAARSTNGPTKLSLDRVTSSSNGTSGVLVSGASGAMYLSNVLTTGNVYGLYPGLGGTYFSFGNNRTGGNTVSDGATTALIPQY